MQIVVMHPMLTIKSVAWGEPNKELFKASQEAIRFNEAFPVQTLGNNSDFCAIQLHPTKSHKVKSGEIAITSTPSRVDGT